MNKVISDTRVPIKIWASDIEVEAVEQLRNLSNMPFIFKHVAAMPDAHAGRGSTVGTVIATKGAIIPSAVGVDIGCGMCAVKTKFRAEQLGDLATLRHSIERSVPTGRFNNKNVSERMKEAYDGLGAVSDIGSIRLGKIVEGSAYSIGSLGGGNHFIEICLDKDNNVWVMLHSGSRNIGKCLAEVHIDKAKDLMKTYFIDLPDPELAYLAQETPEFKAYLQDLMWAQGFAKANRNEMMLRVLKDLSYHILGKDHYEGPDAITLERVDCHHNYTSIENHFGNNIYVTRKGAVSAREGQLGIIPGSMGTKSYIVRGRGNADSFCSCSHGAGRKMSRTQARKTFTLEDLAAQTNGVECRKDGDVLDEIPGAYKSIDQVMDDQKDLVDVVYEIKQVLCVKGA